MRLTHRTIQGYTLLYTEEQKHLVVVWEYVHIHTTPYSLLILGGEKDKKKEKKFGSTAQPPEQSEMQNNS